MASIAFLLKAAGACLAVSASALPAKPPHIIFIVADDLGYSDLGFKNGNLTHTPAINALAADGVQLTDYYTFKICSPSRASMITGRYPWGAGFYDMSEDTNHCTKNFTALPQLLQSVANYSTHAIGKWDVGFLDPACAPSGRGFDSFYGYYTACQSDYWYHGGAGGEEKCRVPGAIYTSGAFMPCTDLSNSSGAHGASSDLQPASNSANGTYNRKLFSGEAARLIRKHAASGTDQPFYLYLAFMNVHDGCGAPYGSPSSIYGKGLQAPLGTVQKYYSDTELDTYKMTGAMVTELDIGVAEVVDALKSTDMWANSLVVFVSDNGGPLDHSTNHPLRGGKHTFLEGGVRVEAMLSGPALHSAGLPPNRRGGQWSGMAHASDWYMTLVEGVAGGVVPENTGPRAPDGHNFWLALLDEQSSASPRTEVVHQVSNAYFKGACQAIRVGDMKLVIGNPGDARYISWPSKALAAVPFGLTGGTLEHGTDHARASGIGGKGCFTTQCHVSGFDVGKADDVKSAAECQEACHKHKLAASDPSSQGCDVFVWIEDTGYCAFKGGGAPQPQKGSAPKVKSSVCGFGTNATCGTGPGLPCMPFCLFNLTADLVEQHDLYKASLSDPQLAALATSMHKRLDYHGSTGGPHAFLYEKDVYQTKDKEMCQQSLDIGALEPLSTSEDVTLV